MKKTSKKITKIALLELTRRAIPMYGLILNAVDLIKKAGK